MPAVFVVTAAQFLTPDQSVSAAVADTLISQSVLPSRPGSERGTLQSGNGPVDQHLHSAGQLGPKRVAS